ncbi:glycerate kinase [Microdochium trichocladiopsis]|uniref:Glycerate kinase n=1 Tax=Microdochium trichocladiopsis TaxID=1682393 RepID=A0A9P9BIV2_9PEZI|nr:glycerate kinase [Microdochium trichocladiopsis]KAH7016058.1 glycerate kinase [Microdochium trichocladiopsis]
MKTMPTIRLRAQSPQPGVASPLTLSPPPSTPDRPKSATAPPKLRILVAPSGFKESLGPDEVADCIEAGIRRVLPDPSVAEIRKLPLHDGGEGFCRALVAAMRNASAVTGTKLNITDGIREVLVTGPVGKPVLSHYGIVTLDTKARAAVASDLDKTQKIGILDMAAAAGLSLVPATCRDPTLTTTYGVGELIAAALDEGCDRIIVGCGDSGTSDGGAGMLQALGARLLDSQGKELPRAAGGASLLGLEEIDMSGLHPRLRDSATKVHIEAVCNIKNILTGPRGVARVYGPQKGASPAQVKLLSRALDKLASVAERLSPVEHHNIGTRPGSGASGGLGTAMLLLGGRLRPREDAIDEYFGVSQLFSPPAASQSLDPLKAQQKKWDLVVTAEGCLDAQSAQGKLTVEIARRARKHGAAVVALAGTIGAGADGVYDDGIAAFTSILDGPRSLRDAIDSTAVLLTDAAERAIRMIQMGMGLRGGAVETRQAGAEESRLEDFKRLSGPVEMRLARSWTS